MVKGLRSSDLTANVPASYNLFLMKRYTLFVMKRYIRRLLILVVVAGLLFVAGSWIFAHQMTRARPSEVGAPPKDFPFPIEPVTLITSDQQSLSGWLVPGENRAKAIVLLHGFGGNRKQMIPRAAFFRKQGYAVFLYDARACGESTGDCITFGYRERDDLVAAVKLLKARDYERISCLGVSQGGATILFAADMLDGVHCVICESVFDEMSHAVDRRMRRFTGVPGWLGASLLVPFAEWRVGVAIDDVKPVDHIGKLRCPVFIISGEQDNRTWPEDTQRLFDAARAPKELWMVPDAGHEDLYRYAGYEEKVLSFLRRHGLE
jgi:pimeloyl-ACP methyl ester carboxylesterase